MHERNVSKFLKKMQEKNVYILCLTICCLSFETFAFIVGILIPQSLHMKGACFVLSIMLFNHPVMKKKVWFQGCQSCNKGRKTKGNTKNNRCEGLNVLLSPETMVGLSFYIYALFVLKWNIFKHNIFKCKILNLTTKTGGLATKAIGAEGLVIGPPKPTAGVVALVTGQSEWHLRLPNRQPSHQMRGRGVIVCFYKMFYQVFKSKIFYNIL